MWSEAGVNQSAVLPAGKKYSTYQHAILEIIAIALLVYILFCTLLLIEILEWPTFGGKAKGLLWYSLLCGSILTHFMFTVSLDFMRRPHEVTAPRDSGLNP